jgi:predicted  nucleic acid-binding Zn-ribbon protein
MRHSIESKKKQILQLEEEIKKAEEELVKNEAEINSSANKIAETSAKFAQAYEMVSKQIVDDIKNINLYASKA